MSSFMREILEHEVNVAREALADAEAMLAELDRMEAAIASKDVTA
jgi:hypothetical protein